MRCVVTGGAGFIGSHLTDSLLASGHEVAVVDDLSSGRREQVSGKASFIRKDIREDLSAEFKGADAVFHFAADPDVRSSATNPGSSFDINVKGTYSVLESCRKADVKRVVFASTSTVYGETDVIPTPESHPCAPISNYGASKLAGEAYLSSFSGSYGIKGTSLRFANIFGERSTHGVMFDFFHKLRKNPERLEVLGDGKQDKSYLYISDCISAILTSWGKQEGAYEAFNVGSEDKVKVDDIARMAAAHMGLKPELMHTGTPRGWTGDVRLMLLDTKKLKALGWRAEVSFEKGAKRYLDWLSG